LHASIGGEQPPMLFQCDQPAVLSSIGKGSTAIAAGITRELRTDAALASSGILHRLCRMKLPSEKVP